MSVRRDLALADQDRLREELRLLYVALTPRPPCPVAGLFGLEDRQ